MRFYRRSFRILFFVISSPRWGLRISLSSIGGNARVSFSPLKLRAVLFTLSNSNSFVFTLNNVRFVKCLRTRTLRVPMGPVFRVNVCTMWVGVRVPYSGGVVNNRYCNRYLFWGKFKGTYVSLSFHTHCGGSLPKDNKRVSFRVRRPTFKGIRIIIRASVRAKLIPIFNSSCFVHVRIRGDRVRVRL